MKNIRAIVAAIIIALLACGYGMSQVAFFNGTSAEYAKKVDTPTISYLALLILLMAAALAFWRDIEEESAE